MPTLAAASQVDAADPLRTSATRKYIRHTVDRSIMCPVEHNLHGVCFIDSIYEHFLHCVGSVHSCQQYPTYTKYPTRETTRQPLHHIYALSLPHNCQLTAQNPYITHHLH
jgi:hypothetical protein